MLPVVVLALRLTLERARWGLPLLALAYAALLLSHLPTALLCSITVIPAYVLFTTRAPARLLRCAAGGALGIGLAAIYLLPAMELQPWISAHELWTSFYRASNWFVMAPERWVDPDTMRVIGSIVLATALLAAGLCLALLQLPDGQERRELGFWVALGLACLILIAGLLPWFWDLPLVAKVQFPWRLLMVVEFALLTALCLAPLGELRRVVVYVFAAAAVALVPGAMLIVTDAWARTGFVWRTGVLDRHDVKEYQPAGYKLAGSRYADLGLEQLKDTPVISCTPAAATCRADSERFRRDAPHGRQRGADHASCCGASSSRPGSSTPACRSSLRAAAPGLVHRAGRPHRGAAGSRRSAHRALGLGDLGRVACCCCAALLIRERNSSRG